MDPNANLKEQLKLARGDWTVSDSDELSRTDIARLHDAHIRLCDLVLALDEWIVKGGQFPIRWGAYTQED
jgi:hypothetical protein